MSLPDKAAYSTYGGEKHDYSPPEDPTTDRAANELNEAMADCSAMTRMIGRAYVTFTISNTNVGTVTDHDAVWGNDIPVKPTITYVSSGKYTVTWPTSVTDARGNAHTPNLRSGTANVRTVAWLSTVTTVTPNTATVELYDTINQAQDDGYGIPITVLVW